MTDQHNNTPLKMPAFLLDKAGWKDELRAMGRLGVPMALTQLVQFSINTIDVLMIGRLGSEQLAGASLGLVLFFLLFMLGFGPAMAVSPMVSQALGQDAENYQDARRSVRMGLWVIVLGFPLAFLMALFAGDVALALGQPEGPTKLAKPYILALLPGWPFAMGVIILRNFLAAIDRTRVPLMVVIITTLINAFLNWLLIYGNWGLPRLELVGAGLASAMAHMIGFGLLVGYIHMEKTARKFDLFTRVFHIDWPRLIEVVRLGWPISVTTVFEGMLFNACVLLMGRIGVDEMAAFQVALNVAALAFMIPWGLSMGGCVRVGLATGASNRDGVIRAALVTMGLCTGVMVIWALVVGFAPRWIAGLYLDVNDPENSGVISLVVSFLPIAAAFMISDGIQVAANQSLRGMKDVRMPMIMTGISYWVIGFPVAAWLGLATPLGAKGVWWGLLISLVVASILLGGRLFWLFRKVDMVEKIRERTV